MSLVIGDAASFFVVKLGVDVALAGVPILLSFGFCLFLLLFNELIFFDVSYSDELEQDESEYFFTTEFFSSTFGLTKVFLVLAVFFLFKTATFFLFLWLTLDAPTLFTYVFDDALVLGTLAFLLQSAVPRLLRFGEFTSFWLVVVGAARVLHDTLKRVLLLPFLLSGGDGVLSEEEDVL